MEKLIELDWEAYFQAFCDKHGEPIECNGRLLFPDGWTYSLTSHAGPEWRPANEPRRNLAIKRTYWTNKRVGILEAYTTLNDITYSLKQLQTAKDCPLKHVIWFEDDEKKVHVPQSVDVNYDELDAQVNELKALLDECDENLVQIAKQREALQ